jgi:hypothetical protein
VVAKSGWRKGQRPSGVNKGMGLRDKGEPSSERVGERKGERQRLIGEEQNPRQRRERDRKGAT